MRIFHWRKMTWAILIWTGVMVAWMTGVGVSSGTSAATHCANDSAVVSGTDRRERAITRGEATCFMERAVRGGRFLPSAPYRVSQPSAIRTSPRAPT